MHVLLDMDGVLTDMVRAAADAHLLEYPDTWPPGQYDLQIALNHKGSRSEFWAHLDGPAFWANMPWMPDGRLILELIEQTGLDITILTSPTLDPYCCAGKAMWISNHLPKYRRKVLIGPQKYRCARPDALLIDDSDSNVDAFIQHGGQAILLPRPWNKRHALPTIPTLIEELQNVTRLSHV